MKEVKFTQFLFPNGREIEATIDRPEPIADRASVLADRGYSFEIENKNGQVFMSCVNHETEKSFSRIVNNGVDVPLAVDSMINEAFAATHEPIEESEKG